MEERTRSRGSAAQDREAEPGRDVADERERDAAMAFAQTLAPGATALTYRPDELRGHAHAATELPFATLTVSKGAAVAATQPGSLEDTAIVYERLIAAQHAHAAQAPAAGSQGAAEAYEIVAPIGRGGMGEVFRAVQRSLGREVAVKQLATDNPAAADYFLSEARVTARLAHANIVPVHALGRAGDGRPMLAMKLVKGTSWQDLLHGGGEGPATGGGASPRSGEAQSTGASAGAPRDLARHLQIFLAVCNAVAFAHAEGFLHRDLKPANVMVADYGQVFVLDWGIAVGLDRKVCDEHGILHVRDVRSPAGTPAYMAPELARGDGAAQGPCTDIYLLGACLHEVATGAPPHDGSDTIATLRHAIESAPIAYGDEVPRELADICRRAMAKLPEDRYPDVVSLRRAVEAFVSHSAARAITEKGLRALDRLRERAAEHGRAAESEKLELARAVHRTYSEARFAFEHALESWPEDIDAQEGLAAAARAMLEHALEAEDLALSARLVAEVDDAELRAKVEALRAKVAAREAELSALREQAQLLDHTRVAGPLSTLFIGSGVVGGVAAIPSRMWLAQGPDAARVPIAVTWSIIAVLAGAFALVVLRRAKRSLVSPRVGWTWTAVGAGCSAAGIIAIAQGEAPFQNVGYISLMIAIGFVAMAMQTRLWLLYPAIVTFVAAVAMGLWPHRRMEIFGVLWFVTLTGVGVALRRGARFDGEAPAKVPAG